MDLSYRNRLRLLSMQYENALQQAIQHDGKDALVYYLEAVQAQCAMAQMLDGEDAERHKREMYRLLHHMRDEIVRLDIEIPDALRKQMSSYGLELPKKQVDVLEHGGAASDAPERKSSAPAAEKGAKKADTKSDDALHGFDPAQLKLKKVPSASFDDFGDMSTEIEAIVNGLDILKKKRDFPGLAGQMSDTSQHILLYGPPGGGKSHFCKAIGHYVMTTFEGGAFFLVMASDIKDYLVGVSERRLAALFEEVEKYEMPVLCIDEIETLCPVRDGDNPHYVSQLVSDFQQHINGAAGSTKALIIGATNYPWRIEGAVLSRLATHVFVDLPDEKHIREYLCKHISSFLGKDQRYVDEMLDLCAKRLEHASYRVLEWVWREMGSLAFKKTTAGRVADRELAEFVPLTRDEIDSIIARASIDYDPKYIARLRDNSQW